jgi:hypothetical protein
MRFEACYFFNIFIKNLVCAVLFKIKSKERLGCVMASIASTFLIHAMPHFK